MSYTLNDFYREIIEMNDLVGNDYRTRSEELIEKYSNFTKEESGESLEASLIKNHTLLLDGMVDTLVVGYFLLKSKGENTSYNKKHSFKNKEDYFLQYIDFLLDVHENKSFKDNIGEIIEFTEYGIYYLKFNFNEACKEVMRSNLSKFPLIEDCEDPDNEVKYIQEKYKDRYKGVHYTIENGRYVFWDENKKFLKPSCFFEPDLLKFVNGETIINDVYEQLEIDAIKRVVSNLKDNNLI